LIAATAVTSERKKKRALAGPLWKAHLDVPGGDKTEKLNGYVWVIGASHPELEGLSQTDPQFVN